jgi:serine protease
MPSIHRFARVGGRLTFVALSLFAFLLTPAFPHSVLAKDHPGSLPHLQTMAPSGRIVVKLATDGGLVMDEFGPRVRPGAEKMAAPGCLDRLVDLVESTLPGMRLDRHIPSASTKTLAQFRRSSLPDLALYGHIKTRDLTREQLIKAAARLAAHPLVETAFLEPVAVPAALGFDAFTGTFKPPAPLAETRLAADKSDLYQELQGYLTDAPLGVSALSMRHIPGQRGAGVTVVDIEGAWLWDHEDLPAPVADLGTHVDLEAWRHHGTAVLGEIRGHENAYGVTGITPDCNVGASSVGGIGTAAALAAALEVLQAGDIILIELHAPGPLSDPENTGQYGYMPMEYWQDVFDVIKLATSRGVIVCEAAGNGFQNLDNPLYQDLFDRSVRDSGAIMCGATEGSELHAADFSNHGQRVDLNGWGLFVTTCGYGDLAGTEEVEFYTQQFSGTSSASPIVTASVASLQGMVRELHGFDLDARLARDLLNQTGTPMDYGNLIGKRPDLAAAYTLATTSVGEVSGTLTDLDTGLPVAGVLVRDLNGGSFTASDDSGAWRLPLLKGPVQLEFSSFFYRTAEITVSVTAGNQLVQDLALEPRPIIDIQGTVSDLALNPLAGVVLTPIAAPVSGTTTDAGGAYTVADVPGDQTYRLRCDGLPGYGVQLMTINAGGTGADARGDCTLPPVTETFEADDGGFTTTDTLWTHGAPPAAVTGGAFDGSSCWGIGMAGDYLEDQFSRLLSPVYDLSSVTAEKYYLSFHYYSATESGFDGVGVEYFNGINYQVLEPLGGYTDPALGGLGGLPGWSGDSGRWQGAVFDITEHVGGDFQFRLTFGSDGGANGAGFFVDGITLGGGGRVSAAPPQGVPAACCTLQAWPNPFNPRVTLSYELPAPGNLRLAVFDVRGRRVKDLWNGTVAASKGTMEWDGTSDEGRRVASGVYFVMASPEQGQPAIKRLVLAK